MRKRKKKDNSSDKELAEELGLSIKYWRYKGRKGIYWYLFSEYVRKRDLFNWGRCISCDKEFGNIREVQAGHYAPAGNCGFGLLFDEMNVHAECAKCNNPLFSPGKLILYRRNLIDRYGEDEVLKLDERYCKKAPTKEWTQLQYIDEIEKLMAKTKKIDEEISKKLKRGS